MAKQSERLNTVEWVLDAVVELLEQKGIATRLEVQAQIIKSAERYAREVEATNAQ